MTITHARFYNNRAVDSWKSGFGGDVGKGGAIIASAGTLTITHARFQFNQAVGKGGAIYAKGGTLTITHAQFTGNKAYSGAGAAGGAIFAGQASIQLLNVSFSGNYLVPRLGNYEPDGFSCNTGFDLSNTHTSMSTKYTRSC